MDWIYKEKFITELPDDVVGFIYMIVYKNGQKYIGKKTARSERKKAPLKGMRKNARRMVLTEHKWRDYEGSSKETENLEVDKKYILHLCTNQMTLTYLETYELFERKVLTSDEYVNKNILGKFFDNCMNGYYRGDPFQPTLF